jgi:flagellar hook-basal body complex protein FliE
MKMTNVNKAMSAYGAAIQRSQAEAPAALPPVAPRFESLVRAELQGTGEALRNSEAKAVEALSGRASLQQVVEAVTEAELSLQKVTAVRDRVISAYQEIMRMPI